MCTVITAPLRIRRQPEPVFVALEELGRDRLLVLDAKIAAPGILTDGKAFFV